MAEPNSSEQSLEPLAVKDCRSPRRGVQRWRRFWFGMGLIVGGSAGLSLGASWWFKNQLSPLIADGLTYFLNRPVQIGDLQYFSLTSLRLGKSQIAATATDPDRVSIEALEIHYNPWTFLWNRKLKIQVTAVNPTIFLEQEASGDWLRTSVQPLDPNHPIDLVQLRVQNAKTTIITRSSAGKERPAVNLSVSQANAHFNWLHQRIYFDLKGNFAQGDRLALQGETQFQTHRLKLQLQGKNLPAPIVSHLLPLPFAVTQGRIESHLHLDWQGSQHPMLEGTTRLQGVRAEFVQLPCPLDQLDGVLHFQGDRIQFEQIKANYGKIAGIIQGEIDNRQGFHLQAAIPETPMQSWVTSLQLPLGVPLQGSLKAHLRLTGSFLRPQLTAALNTAQPSQIDRLRWRSLQTQLAFQDSILTIQQFQAIPEVSGNLAGNLAGNLTGTGTLDFRDERSQYRFDFQTQKFAIAALRPYRMDLPLEAKLTSRGQITGEFKEPDRRQIVASGQIQWPEGVIAVDKVELKGQKWQANLTAQGIPLANLPESSISSIKGLYQGYLQGVFQVAGDLSQPGFNTLQAQGNAQLQFPQGNVAAEKLTLAQGQWQGQFRAQNLALAAWWPDLPPALAGKLDGQFRLAGDLSGNLVGNLNPLLGAGSGRLRLPQGLITAEQVKIGAGRWSGQFNTNNLQVKSFMAAAQDSDRLTGTMHLTGTLLQPRQTLMGKGSARLTLNRGRLDLTGFSLAGDQIKATVLASAIALRPFAVNGRGKVSGRVEMTTTLANWNPARLLARGNVTLSEGIGALRRPFATDFAWNGRRLQLLKLTAPNLTAQGWMDLTGDRVWRVQGFNLALQTQDFPIQDLPLPQSISQGKTSGQLDFEGIIAGNLEHYQVDGKIALINFKSSLLPLKVESILQGKIQSNLDHLLSLNLAGKQDRITLAFDSRYQLSELDLQLDQLRIKGRQQPSQFLIDAADVPLPLLQAIAQVNPSLTQSLPAAVRQALLEPTLRGNLAGRIWLNPQEHSVVGESIAIINPGWRTWHGDRVTANFYYQKGQFVLKEAQFQINKSAYRLSASLTPQKDGMHGQGEISVAEGNIQDILAALQIYDLEDLKRGNNPPVYGKAGDLFNILPNPSSRATLQAASPHSLPTAPPALYSVGLPTTSSRDRLSYFSEQLIRLEKQRQQRRQATPLPPLSELKGTIAGSLKLSFSPQFGFASQFSLQGQNWQWGNYPLLQLLAQGSFQDGILAFEPLNLKLGNPSSQQSQINFVGQIGDQGQQGQLQLVNLPLQEIAKAMTLSYPLEISGLLNGTISLAGSRANPQAIGQWGIEQATFNRQDLPSLQGRFNYRNSRFDFSATSLTSLRREPLTLMGTFPLRLPMTRFIPASDRWEAHLQLQDEDLRLLNIFTGKQLDWISGKGLLRLEAKGRIEPNSGSAQELEVQGLAQITQASFASSLIPVPLTNVQGKMDLNLDRILVENLTGQLNGGNFSLQGSVPILKTLAPKQPLQLTFRDLLLDLKGLYQGRVKGEIQWLGSLLEPSIGGHIELFNGQFLLENPWLEDPFKEKTAMTQGRSLPEFANLELILGENVLISRPPIVTVAATGNLLLNGPLAQPQPEGTILLKSGQVNLFANQLRLASSDNNTAQFSPKWGFDPYLNLRLVTAVSETNRNLVRTTPVSSEINDPFTANNDSLQTVRIQAQIKGLASQLTRNIELTSNPPRNRSEIITLLGGSFVNTLSSGDTTVGLANLAGTAVFGTVQGAIGDALGLSEFRIFSTPLINDQERIRSTQIGVAAEAGVDLTHDLSLSLLQILNADRPPQFGLRYRINENTTLRGSSNFSDDNRGIIEYQRRF